MKRTAMLRRAPMTSASVKPREPKEGACAWCNKPFLKLLPMQKVCGPVCAGRKARADRVAKVKAEREQTRARRLAVKTIPVLLREAQTAFNAFIRARDRAAGYPCISSGRPLDWTGNGVDAGHYRSVGSAPHLRFDERNCHAQSKQDNRYGAGKAVDYRIGLIRRIGLAEVEALEADNAIHKWTREELIALKATYREKLRALDRMKEEA